MRTFIDYSHSIFSLEPVGGVSRQDLSAIVDAFKAKGINPHDETFDSEQHRGRRILLSREWTLSDFSTIATCDFLFVLQEGVLTEKMLLDIGYCLSETIPIVVAAKYDIYGSCIPHIGEFCLRWRRVSELVEQIAVADFAKLSRKIAKRNPT